MRSMVPVIAALVALSSAACATSAAEREPATGPVGAAPRSIVLFIGDGTSLSYWTAARFEAEPLAVERMAEIGLVDTRPHEPASGRVTDSAAGATAYATGVRTYNGAIAVGPDSQAVETVLERAEALGMATGLVATSTVTHATPAAFASHVPDRDMHPEIARQMAEAGLEVLLGGGRGYFDGSLRPDSADLLSGMLDRYTFVEDAAALRTHADDASALLGLFAQDATARAADRSPDLAEMTRAALDVLEEDPDGFFLMVEGSQIDWRGHDNAALEEIVAEVLDLDRAVEVALDFRDRYPETLVIVTADHETGGLALHPAAGGDYTGPLAAHYTTTGHTAQMVPLFADGPGAGLFGRILDIDEVGRRIRDVVGSR